MRLFASLPRTAFRLVFAFSFGAALSGCASGDAGGASGGWSLWPWDISKSADATANIEYQRTRSEGGKEPMYTLLARNTHLTKTIEGRMRTTMQPSPGDIKVDTQSFTLAPSEVKKLLIYPVRIPLTYEVTAFFRD